VALAMAVDRAENKQREMDSLNEQQRDALMGAVADHVHTRVCAAVKHCWTVCDALDYDPAILHPEAIAWLAAVYTIPQDAATADVGSPES
jgi:hypothetical protein